MRVNSEEKFISVQMATVHQIHFRQEIKSKIESGQITLNMKPFQPEVGAIKTFTENWVGKQSFFVLILPTA